MYIPAVKEGIWLIQSQMRGSSRKGLLVGWSHVGGLSLFAWDSGFVELRELEGDLFMASAVGL